MQNRLLFLILLLIAWLIIGCLVCKKYICGFGGAAAIAAVADEGEENTSFALGNWLVNDDNEFSTNSANHFSFNKNNAAFLPLPVGLKSSVNETALYLKNNENRSLDITGYYTNDEKNESLFTNLGMARAENVKNLLLGAGVSATQININGKLLPNNKWLGENTFNKGIEFGFSAKNAEDLRISEIKKRLLGKPVTLYFETNSDNIKLTETQRKDFTDLIYYLDRVPNATLAIGGHTDNVGNVDSNVKLSKKRADIVANYINKRGGIAKNKMAMQGFGPNKPVTSNNTDEDRQKNRRVEVILK